MRILVCGGRNYHNPPRVKEVLSSLHTDLKFNVVITGGASGADSSADAWAQSTGVDRIIFPANWTGRGRGAGPWRNELMLEIGKPAMVVAFPGGDGTANTVALAKERGIPVHAVED